MMRLENAILIHAGMFNVVKNYPSGKEFYISTIKYDGCELSQAGVYNYRGLYKSKSVASTVILPKSENFEDLCKISDYIDIVKNSNVSLGLLFKEMVVDVNLELWSCEHEGKNRTNLWLKEIYIDPEQIKNRMIRLMRGEK